MYPYTVTLVVEKWRFPPNPGWEEFQRKPLKVRVTPKTIFGSDHGRERRFSPEDGRAMEKHVAGSQFRYSITADSLRTLNEKVAQDRANRRRRPAQPSEKAMAASARRIQKRTPVPHVNSIDEMFVRAKDPAYADWARSYLWPFLRDGLDDFASPVVEIERKIREQHAEDFATLLKWVNNGIDNWNPRRR
jgi:hypothetical protein